MSILWKNVEFFEISFFIYENSYGILLTIREFFQDFLFDNSPLFMDYK